MCGESPFPDVRSTWEHAPGMPFQRRLGSTFSDSPARDELLVNGHTANRVRSAQSSKARTNKSSTDRRDAQMMLKYSALSRLRMPPNILICSLFAYVYSGE